MKATKKLVSLFLAVMMVLSVMAMTAAAYSEEGHVHDETCSDATIQPRKPATPVCPYCGVVMSEGVMDWDNLGRFIWCTCRNSDCVQCGLYREKLYC